MIDRIFVEDNAFVFCSYDRKKNRVVPFDCLDMLDNMSNINFYTSGVKVNIPICMDVISKFLVIYEKIFNGKENNSSIIIDISDLSDDDIKANSDKLKLLETKTKCLFSYRYNIYDTATISEILNAIEFVEKQAEIVKYYKFTPLESLVFIFDVVRDREYVKEDETEDLNVSRNLSDVVSSSKIVCAGYANLFSAIANKVGIYTEMATWFSNDSCASGHASNICYVNDPIYDVHGVVEVDVTLGRKRNFSNDFLNNYGAFGKSISIARERNIVLNLEQDCRENMFKNVLRRYKAIFDDYEIIKNVKFMYKNFVLNFISALEKYKITIGEDISDCIELRKMIDGDFEVESISLKLKELFEDFKYSCFEFNVDYVVFSNVLYNVRRVECAIDHNKYLLSIFRLSKILENSYRDDFVFQLFGISSSNFARCICDSLGGEEKADLDIERMKLISTLKKIKRK